MQSEFKERINQTALEPTDLKLSIGFEDIDNVIYYYFNNMPEDQLQQNMKTSIKKDELNLFIFKLNKDILSTFDKVSWKNLPNY